MTTTDATESKCDVLVIGAGPAGLMLAAWMARFGVHARIVDKRRSEVMVGQADGINIRSLEIMDSFGFADRVVKEANFMSEMSFWNPDDNGVIHRSQRMPPTPPGLSRYEYTALLNQGRVERFFLDNIEKHSNGAMRIERSVLPESLEIAGELCDDHSDDNYPVTVKLRCLGQQDKMPVEAGDSTVPSGLHRSNLAEDSAGELTAKSREPQGSTETVKAKYVVGCDGAHSWTRQQLGFGTEGESTDSIWGVLDIIPLTDFPDIRNTCIVRSQEHGSILTIPREGKLVRVYIQLNEVKAGADGRADRSGITPDSILEAAQRIIAPYTLTYEYCEWWTVYQIGQRLCDKFDYRSRVFLAGDAVHTHSPKAGQGMNVSMQDSFNLGWKLGMVVKGVAYASILKTYENERHTIAKELIDFDRKWAPLFSGRSATDFMNKEGVTPEKLQQVLATNILFVSGVSVDYGASMLVAKSGGLATGAVGRQELAPKAKLGMRLASQRVVNQADGQAWQLQQKLVSDGRFRIIVFAGNLASEQQQSRVQQFCRVLASSGFLQRHLQRSITVLTCHSAKRSQVELLRDVPAELRRWDSRTGWDYEAVFVDDEGADGRFGDAYGGYGVARETGCVVVTRPDQHVGHIASVDGEGAGAVEGYLCGVLAP